MLPTAVATAFQAREYETETAESAIDDNRIKGIYGAGAHVYDDAMSQYWEFDRRGLVESLDLRPGRQVLEIGVGTGLNLPHYPSQVHVVGIDFTPQMLALAKQRAAELGGSDIDLLEMDASNMTFPDNTFDGAVASFVLCVVTDVAAVFSEIVRVTRPGSVFALFDYCLSREADVAKWQRLIAPAAATLGFPTGVIVWEALRDYAQILREKHIPLHIVEETQLDHSNPFLVCTRMLLRNDKA